MSAAVRMRRVLAAAALVLASGSAAIGAARGAEVRVLATGSVELPASTASAAARPAPSPTPTPSTAAQPTTQPSPAATARATATPNPAPRVPDRGNGRMLPVAVPGADTSGTGRPVTYAFEVEDGLGIDRAATARMVGQTLRDPRGWERADRVRFVQVTPAQRAKGIKPQVIISLVSPAKVDQMCAPLSTEGQWSCANKDHAVLNYRRWAEATPTYGAALPAYRAYLINHEVGHELGHGHVKCPGAGRLAPVLVQQSKGLDGCRPNAWPVPTDG